MVVFLFNTAMLLQSEDSQCGEQSKVVTGTTMPTNMHQGAQTAHDNLVEDTGEYGCESEGSERTSEDTF